jgi:glycosyltransferase involved in cell wall biosynthesis
MLEHLVRGRFDRIEVHHLRLGFSTSISSVGRAEVGKVIHLIGVILRAIGMRIRERIDLVVFSPAGPRLVPVLRDVVLLHVLRRLYPRVVFHFHAAGVSEYLKAAPRWLRLLAFSAYKEPDAAIQTSALNPPDGVYVRAKRTTVIPNGIPDEARSLGGGARSCDDTVRILYVGILTESKGVMVLLEAFRRLLAHNQRLIVWFMGQFSSAEFEQRVRGFCSQHGMEDGALFVGQKVGSEKWAYFSQADILCFPSHYEAESFGLVAVEGMMFGLPVVATRWRGIPDVVDEGETGLLVPPDDPEALASALELLIRDPDLRRRMGAKGRERYLARFSIEQHLGEMEAFLYEIAST